MAGRRRGSSGVRDAPLVAASTGKSRGEVSALRHLREAHDALAVGSSGGTSRAGLPLDAKPKCGGSPAKLHVRSRGRLLDAVRSLQHKDDSADSGFDQWLALETLAVAIDTDAAALRREIDACDAKASVVRRLPVDAFDGLDPKWLVLHEVLGHEAFASYTADVFGELAALRRRCTLYGDTLKQFQEQITLRCIGSHRVREAVSHHEWLDIANAALAALQVPIDKPVLASHFPVLMHHCSPPHSTRESENGVVVVAEVLELLERLSPARERLLSLCFEQISDVRRGSGTAPPPEGIRPHKLAALAKQSHADTLSSREEVEAILAWLDGDLDGETTVSRTAFLRFHTAINDVFAHEDAQFVTFLMRVWRFELPATIGSDELGNVVANYELRCQELANKTRKIEVLKKLDHLHAALPSKLASLRLLVGQIEAVNVHSSVQLANLVANDHVSCSTLTALRVLRLSGLSLREFPLLVVALPLLETLDLSGNQLRESPLPLAAIGGMKTLTNFVLSENALSDRSFASGPDPQAWHGLTALATVDLAHNQLTIIPTVVLQLPNLQNLSLASNKLRDPGVSHESLEAWRVRGCPRLVTLDVRENELTALPEVLFATGRQSLETLLAQDNQIEQLPASFALLERVKEANLARNRLRSAGASDLASMLSRCSRWSELALGHNRLRQFPVAAATTAVSVNGLLAIRLPKNRLRLLPALHNVVFTACAELDLQGNLLSEIDDGFFTALPLLRVCRLQQNAIARLPDSITTCEHLQVLELQENKLASVPPALATLRRLAVLNLRDNELPTVPAAWHAFAFYQDHAALHQRPTRVLQTLDLQRNPLRNKVLQTLVDGASAVGGSSSTKAPPFKSSATQICELYLRKLIDALQQSVPVLRLARAAHNAIHEDCIDSDDEGDARDGFAPRRRSQWKGRARFVLQYVEAQLKARCETSGPRDAEAARDAWRIETLAFQKLLQRLFAASTRKEIQRLSERFQLAGGGAFVDGMAFLRGVESVGLCNALEAAQEKRGAESVRKPADAVASILQYLQVAHEHKLRGRSEPEEVTQAMPTPSAIPTRRPQSATTAPRSGKKPVPATPAANCQPQARERERRKGLAATQREQRDPRDAEVARQRQRVLVLEQQLLDQRLLRLAEQKSPVNGVEPLAQICPAERDDNDASVLVHVKQLNGDAQTDTTGLVVLAISPQATVAQLKLAIASRLHVEAARQVLIAKRPGNARDHVRLRDDAVVAAFCLAGRRWHVSLVVSDQLTVDWAAFQQRTRRSETAGDAAAGSDQ